MGQEFVDNVGRGFDVIGGAAHSETAEAAEFDGGFGGFDHDGNAIDDRGAVEGVAMDAGEQQHGDAAAGDQDIDALGDERAGLFGVFAFHVLGEIVALVSAENFARFEGHGVDAGDAMLQPVFADLVVKPRDIARIDRHDTGPLTKLAGVDMGASPRATTGMSTTERHS